MSDEASWLAGLEESARTRLPPEVFEYVAHGARDGLERRRGERRLARRCGSAARVLRDVAEVDLSVTLLGHRVAVPWGVAPTTLQRTVHPEGELAMARATAAARGLMVVSSNAGTPFAEIGATGVHWWLQAYLPEQRALAEPLLASAVEAGAAAVVLTVDTPVVGTGCTRAGDPGRREPPPGRLPDPSPRPVAWLTTGRFELCGRSPLMFSKSPGSGGKQDRSRSGFRPRGGTSNSHLNR